MFKGVGENFKGLIIGGVIPKGVKINLVKGGMNILFWIILVTIKRRRSGSFCFNKNHKQEVGEPFKDVTIDGFTLELSDKSQHFFIVESNSLTRNQRGFKKKKDIIRGILGSSPSTESTENERVYI
jgi:hypothetical protein